MTNFTSTEQFDEMPQSPVYVLADERDRITRCEGGYTMGNIADLTLWTLIDEGNGDRYNLCQSNYFPDGLYTEDGIPRCKLVPDAGSEYGYSAVLRDEAEIEADRAAIPPPPESDAEKIARLEGEIAALLEGEG